MILHLFIYFLKISSYVVWQKTQWSLAHENIKAERGIYNYIPHWLGNPRPWTTPKFHRVETWKLFTACKAGTEWNVNVKTQTK